MGGLLFLSHRIPYPPNKGDKIRSFNMLKRLARSYPVYLGTFIDDPVDWKYVGVLDKICNETFYRKLHSRTAKIKSITGLLTGAPLTIPYYHNKSLETWVDDLISQGVISHVFIYSSSMAQYTLKHVKGSLRSIVDFVDVDSDKWKQYSKSTPWPINWIYCREHKRLLAYERKIAREFDVSIFVSSNEADLFKSLSPGEEKKITYVENGVDTDFFSPKETYQNPYPDNTQVLVFTGAMDYWANVEAVTWFAQEVFPDILLNNKNARFYIVGSHPTDAVSKLAENDGIEVTGAVTDIRPYLALSDIAVASLRIARGVQNKVLEAMSMAKPVIMTTQAESGIDMPPELAGLTFDQKTPMVSRVLELLGNRNERERIGKIARQFVISRYGWDSNLNRLEALLAVEN